MRRTRVVCSATPALEKSRLLHCTCSGEERTSCSGEMFSSPLHVLWRNLLFSATCALEKSALLCYICSGEMFSSPLHVQRRSLLFSATCAAEKSALLRYTCSGEVCPSPLHM